MFDCRKGGQEGSPGPKGEDGGEATTAEGEGGEEHKEGEGGEAQPPHITLADLLGLVSSQNLRDKLFSNVQKLSTG